MQDLYNLITPARFVFPSPAFKYRWEHGHGKAMLNKISYVPAIGDIQTLIPLLFEYDTIADKVVTQVYQKNGYVNSDTLLNSVLEKGIGTIADVPESLKELFAEIEAPPPWLDYDLLEHGASFCRRSGAHGLIVLRNYSLMGGYESSGINKPLIFTDALKKGAPKRMDETLDFWLQVTSENGMRRNGIGYRSAAKLRIIHAYVRASILKSPDWKSDLWGSPLNTWDMVATNLGFSIVFMDGLRKLGYRPAEREYEGVLHLWKYIGFLIGTDPAHLPDTEKQAIAALYKWSMSQSAADDDTIKLAHALMSTPTASKYFRYKWQDQIVIKFNLAYNHFFLGRNSCKALGLPDTLLKFFPYLESVFVSLAEYYTKASLSNRNASVEKGRKTQDKIKKVFEEAYLS